MRMKDMTPGTYIVRERGTERPVHYYGPTFDGRANVALLDSNHNPMHIRSDYAFTQVVRPA